MKRSYIFSLIILCAIILTMAVVWADETAPKGPEKPTPPPSVPTIDSAYPGLASGILTFAKAVTLTDGILLQSGLSAEVPQGGTKAGELKITTKDLDAEMSKSSPEIRSQLMKNAFFLLEQNSTEKLLLLEARAAAVTAKKDLKGLSDKEIIQQSLKPIQDKVTVTDSEVKDFYENNKDMCGGATLEQVKNDLKKYVLEQKQQDAINEHIRTMGQRVNIEVDKTWLDKQYVTARDNPVDKARSGGLPSLIDFGSTGCRPCDMMAPILATLKKKYENKLNVLFIHVGEEKILAARYGIQSIPVQIFFDKSGKEVFRHTGFFPQAEIEKKLNEMGVK